MSILVTDWSAYQADYHGDPYNFDQLYSPSYWTVSIDFASALAGMAGVILRAGIGTRKDPCFDRYLAGVKSTGKPLGIYHAYDPSAGSVAQADLVRGWCHEFPPLGVWGDVEMGDANYPATNAYLHALDMHYGRTTGIYSGGPYLNSHFTAAEQSYWRARRLWIAGYPHFIPPYGWDAGRAHTLHQYTNAYQLPGMTHLCDMSMLNPALTLADLIGDKPMPETDNRGCLIGGHTQGNSSIIPIYTALKSRGARLKFIISDEDGGKMIDAAALGVETRINRKHLPESGPDHDFEAGGDAGIPWPADKEQRYITTAVNLPYKASPTEFKATTHFQVTGNEWERDTPEGWTHYLNLLQQVIIQGEQRSTHDKAVLMGVSDAEAATLPPVRYALPVFNAGSPHTWAMYQAIAAHSIWPLAASRGDLLFCHEGIGFDQPFDFGENQTVEPGAPQVPGAGWVNFRIFNLLWLLSSRGVRVKWGSGEWYDGRRGRGTDVLIRVMNMIRHDELLAASPFAADCVGYGQFQFDDNPASPWYAQDCTLLWQTPEWQAHLISVSDRINGDPTMPITQSTIDAMRAKQAGIATLQGELNTIIAAIVPDDTHKHTLADRSNQYVLNLFAHVFGGFKECDAVGLTAKLAAARQAGYVGPAIEDMALTADQKAALIAGIV